MVLRTVSTRCSAADRSYLEPASASAADCVGQLFIRQPPIPPPGAVLWAATKATSPLSASRVPIIEEIHTVAGDTAMILKARTESTASLEQLLGELHRIKGFRGVKTFVALGTYLERRPMPGHPSEEHGAR